MGVDLYLDFRLASAKSLTQNSRVGRIEGLVLWLEASQKTSFEPDNIADGIAITKWKNIAPNLLANDRSRFDAVKSSLAASGPIYGENIVNSLPALEMSSSQNRCMQVPSGFDGDGQNTTVFLVIKMPRIGHLPQIIECYKGGRRVLFTRSGVMNQFFQMVKDMVALHIPIQRQINCIF